MYVCFIVHSWHIYVCIQSCHCEYTWAIIIMMQYSWNALMSASEQGHTDVVRILLEAGASRSHTKEKVKVLHC